MARPKASGLTERELELMRVFWDSGPATVQQARDLLAGAGRDLAYTTVATLVRICADKGYLKQLTDRRPFEFAAARSYEEVSGRLLGDLVQKVFGGSRQELLLRLFDSGDLTAADRQRLRELLDEKPAEGTNDG